jgi:hypothetical protein
MSSSYLDMSILEPISELDESYRDSSRLVDKIVKNLHTSAHRFDKITAEAILRWRLSREILKLSSIEQRVRRYGVAIDAFCHLYD